MRDRQVVNLRPYFDVIYRHRRSFLWVLVAGLGLTACVAVMLPPIYRSSALLVVEPPKVASRYVPEPAAINASERIELLSQSALGRGQLEKVIRSFDLYPRRRAAGQPMEALADLMREHIVLEPTVDPQRSGRQPATLRLSFEYPVPALAQAVTVRLSKILVEADRAERITVAAAADRFLRDQTRAARASLDEKRGEITAFEERHAQALPDEMANNLRQLDRLQQRLRLAAGASMRVRPASPRSRLDAMETHLAILRAHYSDAYPDVAVLRAEIDALKHHTASAKEHSSGARLDGASTAHFGWGVADRGLQKRRAALLRQIAEVHELIAETPANAQQLAAYKSDYAALVDNYTRLMRQRLEAQAEMRLQQRGEGERLGIVAPAGLPLQPVRPNRAAVLALGVMLSLVAAIALPFGLFFTDSSFRNPEELAHEHGSPVLIAIPEIKELGQQRDRPHNGVGAGAAAFAAFSISTALWLYATRPF